MPPRIEDGLEFGGGDVFPLILVVFQGFDGFGSRRGMNDFVEIVFMDFRVNNLFRYSEKT